ncbi:MAG TPA: pyruvate:ferredoxin (flavodoxin) oxidoreductase [Firmicutes bacterium]|nr:pyruvate:ferredoxin (flavodoxin) oxidoreductase [Bacillota bacterium]
MKRAMKTMDGNTAAAHVAYAFTEVAAIYPITPSSVMAECVDKWSANGRKNLFGQTVRVAEMQSEGGAAGAVHGSLTAGALTTTFTASQGLLLMIPNMYKIAGSHLPAVIHVSARALATHALSIFGDQSDVMACRQTGFALLCSTNPQEVMDLAAVAHLATLKGEVPFLHFFDGFRTSHEIRKIAVWDYKDLDEMLDPALVRRFRDRALNPDHPALRGSAQNPDIFFQSREADNAYYLALPGVVQETMDMINEKIGTNYHLFDYYGSPEAKTVMIAMGSVCDAAEEVVDYINAKKGDQVGLIKVRLYRPFSIEHFLSQLPATCQNIVVMDRCKEAGAPGEPLYLDVVRALNGSAFAGVRVVGGRYGLGSKDTTPGGILAAFKNAAAEEPINGFTININDDVTHLSLPIAAEPNVAARGTIACKFWGLGSDGTVGANKNSIKIIGDHTDLYVQAYFQYDSKKSGGVTISHLRFGKQPIKSTYYVTKADFVACHCPAYMEKYNIVQDIKPGGTFLLNCEWQPEDLDSHLSAEVKRYLARNKIKFYICDAIKLARDIGLGERTNMVLQAAFFKLANIIPIDDAVEYMKNAVQQTYGHKGEKVVNMNCEAIDEGLHAVRLIEIPEEWKTAKEKKAKVKIDTDRKDLAEYVEKIMIPANAMQGDTIPVSVIKDICPGGTLPQGTSQFERRGIAVDVPEWVPRHCIQCNRCVMVCPHGVLRSYAITADELAGAPSQIRTAAMIGRGLDTYKFAISVSPVDCTGCGSCANVCPAKNKAIDMKPYEEQLDQQEVYDYALKHFSDKNLRFPDNLTKEAQFHRPLLEFSGACGGCGETPYAKLVTQLFGDHMYIANATGCSSIWGGSAPSTPYTVNDKGRGPAWENSLFEDNAEFGYGMKLAVRQRRAKLHSVITELAHNPAFAEIANRWLAERDDYDASRDLGDKLIAKCKQNTDPAYADQCAYILENQDMLAYKSVWIFGGDGWAYDIGYGGLDHVLASGLNVNVLVFDTEVYSNTGGQASKATPTAATAQFAAAGKAVKKKDLAAIAMSYGYVYVAQVAMGADYEQCMKAFLEAEAYDGPSLIIAYAPCINHGIKAGMSKSMTEMEKAVKAGYWHLFRYDPRRISAPFRLDSKEPNESYRQFVMGEHRYSSLTITFPERAKELLTVAENQAKNRYLALKKRAKDD